MTVKINDLPSDVLQHIFLIPDDPYQLILYSKVCKAWRDVAEDRDTWQRLTFNFHYIAMTSNALENLDKKATYKALVIGVRKLQHKFAVIFNNYYRYDKLSLSMPRNEIHPNDYQPTPSRSNAHSVNVECPLSDATGKKLGVLWAIGLTPTDCYSHSI